jgi:hypothetical protein
MALVSINVGDMTFFTTGILGFIYIKNNDNGGLK